MPLLIANNIDQIAFLAILLLLSAIFSGCETAIFSLKNHDLNRIRKSSLWVDSLIINLYQDLPEFLLTILLGNMIVNILYFAVSSLFVLKVHNVYGSIGGVIFGVISFASVLILGEITPKSIATVMRVNFARAVVIPIYYIHLLSLPIRFVLRNLIAFFERIINLKRKDREHSKEIRTLLGLEKKRGNINDLEAKLLESVIKLPEIKVAEIMTARVDVRSVLEGANYQEVVRIARKSGHNKIPVRSNENDEYIAWVDARDLFFADSDTIKISDHYREFGYISVYDRCDSVLDKFINIRERMTFVLDERGSCAGIVVLSDVLAEIFGDFGDEESKPEEWATGNKKSGFIIDGRLNLRDLGDLFQIEISSTRSTTVGGLITDILGRSACKGDVVEFESIRLTVLETFKRRIQKVSAVCINVDLVCTEEDGI